MALPEPSIAPRDVPEARLARPRLPRVAALCLLLLPLNAYWAANVVSDIIFSLLVPPLCSLMALAALNAALRRRWPRQALIGAELALVYVVLSVGTAMSAEWLLINMPYVTSYGLFSDRSPWDREHILPYLPDWFYLKDAAAMEDLRRGGFGLLHLLGRVGVWGPAVAAWTLFFGLLAGAMLCVNTLMRELWTRREKLAFPMVQVPVLLTRPESPAWRSPILWGAFAVMLAIDVLNGVSSLVPSVPTVNVRFLVGRLVEVLPWMAQPPWVSVGWTSLGLFPYMAALGVFMPSDLLFSCVFFFLARKALQFGMEAHGYEQGVFGGGGLVPSPPYFSEQTWGGVLALFAGTLYASRGYLRELWRHIVRGTPTAPGGPPPRLALAGLLGCLGGLAGIGAVCGLSPWIVLAYVGAFLVFSIVLTRMRAQVGPPIHEMAFFGPHQLLLAFGAGPQLGEAATVRLYHLFFVANRIHRTHPMPYQLEAYKLGDEARLSPRLLLAAIALAAIVGVAVGQIAYLHRAYLEGAAPSWGEAGGAIRGMGDQEHRGSLPAMLAILAGFAIVLLLDTVRLAAPGFPLHPVGYVLSANYGIDYCWFGLLVVLLLKTITLRYGGLGGYERLRLAAIGVLLAEFAAEMVWSIWAMATGIATYSVSFYGRAGWLR
ncbi:MAG: hypothetical protein IT208_13230 [Chthonomonadales bacterium]|nr:hypothetical protein [Chthonomonadales bacterium]